MKQNIRLLLLATLLCLLSWEGRSQVIVGSDEEYDLDYLTPKTYEIGGVTFEGAENFDTRVVQLVAGLQVGDRVKLPGDRISGAIENLPVSPPGLRLCAFFCAAVRLENKNST